MKHLEQGSHGDLHYLNFNMQEISECKKCSRIVKNLVNLRLTNPDYQNKPIVPVPCKKAFLCIVGLAPGLSGANRTGKIFDGDFSGNILSKVLELSKYSKSNEYLYPYITNAVKCFPPKNKPLASEINNCNTYLSNELKSLKNLRVIIVLGLTAHNAVLRSYSLSRKQYKFSHGNIHKLNKNLVLADSYHCSKINIYTKRLTLSMLVDVFKHAMTYK